MHLLEIKKILLLVSLLLIICCKQNVSKDAPQNEKGLSDSSIFQKKFISRNPIKNLRQLKTKKDSSLNYAEVKASILEIKSELNDLEKREDTLSSFFTKQLLNRIIPFWEGTSWSFEGHSSIPQQGEIACGYFVSTTLQDVGLHINRYKLAQQNPILEATTLALDSDVIHILSPYPSENISSLRDTLSEGIHFIGFDHSHVGYILKEKGQLYLIHSNFIDTQGVMIEKIEYSEVFKFYSQFFVAELSTNQALLEYWVSGKKVPVLTQLP